MRPETTRSRDRGFDPPEQLAAVTTLLALSAALVEGGRRGFATPPVLAAGLAFLPTSIAVFVADIISGRRSDSRRVIMTGAVLVLLAATGLLVAGHGTSYVTLVGQLTLLGLGIGLIVPAMTSAMLSSVDATRSGVASGTLNTARQSGSVVGVALFGSFLAGGLIGGLRLALLVSAVLAVAVAVLARLLPTPSGEHVDQRDPERRHDEAAGHLDAALEATREVTPRARDRGEEYRAGRCDADR
jgi:MFS family permease